MFYMSEIQQTAPSEYQTPLQRMVYQALEELHIPFYRIETDEAITMEDCVQIDEKLDMKMVKTLFLCDRKQTRFYLFITCGDKPFRSKNFSRALGAGHVSFAPVEKMDVMLGTKIGAATVFSVLLDEENAVQVVFDSDVLKEEWYGCSDGTTTSYMKIKTQQIVHDFLTAARHQPAVIEV